MAILSSHSSRGIDQGDDQGGESIPRMTLQRTLTVEKNVNEGIGAEVNERLL